MQVVTDDVLTHQSCKPASPVREDPIGNPELQVADPPTDHRSATLHTHTHARTHIYPSYRWLTLPPTIKTKAAPPRLSGVVCGCTCGCGDTWICGYVAKKICKLRLSGVLKLV